MVALDDVIAQINDMFAGLPPETWRDGRFSFDDYLTESVHTGTIEVVDHADGVAPQ